MRGPPSPPADSGPAGAWTPDLMGRLARLPLNAPADCAAGAAVTILLRPLSRDWETLLLVRADRPGDSSSGQIGLPGGRREVADPDLRATALRELQEEVGQQLEDLEPPLVFLQSTQAHAFGLEVAVFLARVRTGSRAPRAADPTEVAEVFWMPLAALGRAERVEQTRGETRFEVDATVYGRHVVWGFTRRVLLEAIRQLDLAGQGKH
ncbi:MAG: CoA pyrophosphatase [Thermoplasmata archaeon]|nr:CoA pyrophosphatase [Thermoplasmata archaeon]